MFRTKLFLMSMLILAMGVTDHFTGKRAVGNDDHLDDSTSHEFVVMGSASQASPILRVDTSMDDGLAGL